jgi:hypothetical protein
VFDQLRAPGQSVPQLERLVAELTADDFGTLRFEILERVRDVDSRSPAS